MKTLRRTRYVIQANKISKPTFIKKSANRWCGSVRISSQVSIASLSAFFLAPENS
jgi:hypothetical protein